MKHTWREELAWAAGFFDGEGCVTVSRNSKMGRSYSLRLSVSQTNAIPLERFRSAIGGFGSVNGPYWPPSASKQQRKPIFNFNVSGFTRVQAVIGLLWEFLSEQKRKQYQTRLAIMLANRKPLNSTVRANLTQCHVGHPYDESNTAIRTDGNRRCKTCHREGTQRRRKSVPNGGPIRNA